MPEYEEKVSGFRLEGSWSEVVDHGERIAHILINIDEVEEKFSEEFYEYNDWRPKPDENIDVISKKTSKKASIDRSKNEIDKENLSEEAKKSKKEIEKTYYYWDLSHLKRSLKSIFRVTNTIFRRFRRYVQKVVFERVMTIISPYYFDNKLINAYIAKKSDNHYVLEINISNDKIKSKVSEKLNKSIENEGEYLGSRP